MHKAEATPFAGAQCRILTASCCERLAAIGGVRQIFGCMNLEDHLGDIVRKARAMSHVPAAVAAEAAGISEDELSRLEESGKMAAKINFGALGKVLGLHSPKLEGIANGWLPETVDLGRWREIRAFTSSGEGLTVNCYLIWDEATREAALFDTGLNAAAPLDCLRQNELQLRHIFITHSHWDHVETLPGIREAWPKARVHSGSKGAPVDQRNKPNEIVHVGGLRVTHRETPGHAEDGVTYIAGNWQEDAPHVAIVGDTIFAGSMGRGNQSWELARQKIRDQILSLPPETLLCPGHGPLTTVAEEKAHNPFF